MDAIKKKYTSIDEYIVDFPDEVQVILRKIRILINKLAPKAEETISYQIPTFKLNKKNFVHFAAYNHYIGFYPTSSGIREFNPQLAKYQFSKRAVRFPLDQPIPYDLIK